MHEKILIIEDEFLIAEDLKVILQSAKFNIIGIADRYSVALDLFQENHPDIIISDIVIKGKINGIETVKDLLRIKHIPVIFITAYTNDDIINQLANIRDIFYITKPFSDVQVIATVKMASAKIQKAETLPKASNREQELIDLMFKGYNITQIADKLNIGVETVKTHRRNIYTKYDVKSAPQLLNLLLNHNSY